MFVVRIAAIAIVACTLISVHAYSPLSLPSSVTSSRRRRQVLATWPPAMSVVVCPSFGAAATASNPAEAIRRSAANIPGYGPTDVFYPSFFAGKWQVRRETVTPPDAGDEKLPATVVTNYQVRFIPSIDDTAVVADRGFNQVSLENALNTNNHSDAISYEWSESNPNDLRLVFADGRRREIKVTKRATEQTEDTVTSSEFQRIITESANGIPAISARRVLTKWKRVTDGQRGDGATTTTIEGIELIYDVGGSLGDPLAATMATPSAAPRVISKSRVSLQRLDL